MRPGAEGHYGLFQDTEDGGGPMGCSNVSRIPGIVMRSARQKRVGFFHELHVLILVARWAPPLSEHTSHGDKQQPQFPAVFKPVAGATAPPSVCQLPLQHFHVKSKILPHKKHIPASVQSVGQLPPQEAARYKHLMLSLNWWKNISICQSRDGFNKRKTRQNTED